jgi:hypothetical protein
MSDGDRYDIADSILNRSLEREIEEAEIVRGSTATPSPISLRLSVPLLRQLDRIAEEQHRKRGNLIRHILWEYVRAHESSRPAVQQPSASDAVATTMTLLRLTRGLNTSAYLNALQELSHTPKLPESGLENLLSRSDAPRS